MTEIDINSIILKNEYWYRPFKAFSINENEGILLIQLAYTRLGMKLGLIRIKKNSDSNDWITTESFPVDLQEALKSIPVFSGTWYLECIVISDDEEQIKCFSKEDTSLDGSWGNKSFKCF